MKITLNNDPMEINDNTTVENLIQHIGFQNYQLAVAINSRVVPKTKWQQTLLHENDNIIIIKAVSGG
jgi:sulfur carrier protein